MTDREAMKLALEALEQSVSAMRGLYGGWRCTTALKESDQAITALRQALEQPEQEPLTEKRIEELYSFWVVDCQDIVGFARAVERATSTNMAHRAGGLSMEQEPVTWRNAAIRLGEDLCSVGPNGYYDMTASQWLDWALSVVNTAPPKREWVGLTDEEMLALIAYEPHPLANRTAIINAVERLLKEKNA